jgi:hypothetical protein
VARLLCQYAGEGVCDMAIAFRSHNLATDHSGADFSLPSLEYRPNILTFSISADACFKKDNTR